MNIEEAHKYLQPALLHDKEHTDCGACALVADLLLAVLDEAEECVVPPSAGWDDEALRDRIQARR